MIKFLKPFRLLTEEDRGYEINSICYFANRPYIAQTRTVDDDSLGLGGSRKEEVIVQYRRSFYLNLWFCIISFDWLSKNKAT